MKGQEHGAGREGEVIRGRTHRVSGAADLSRSLLDDGGPNSPCQPAAMIVNN